MAIVGGGSIVLVGMCAALVFRSYYKRRLSGIADVKDTESLAVVALTATSRQEEQPEVSHAVLRTNPSINDGRVEEVPSEIAFAPSSQSLQVEVGEGYPEQIQNQPLAGPSNQHQRRSTSYPNTSSSAYHHDSDLDSASFHTNRASSSRPGSFPIRPLPPIPRSRPGSSITTNPRHSLTPILTEFHMAAVDPGPSRRWTDAHVFQREVRRRESRTGLSTAHSQSSIFSLPPPSYNSARLPAYQLPGEEVPPLPGQYRLGAGSGDGSWYIKDDLAKQEHLKMSRGHISPESRIIGSAGEIGFRRPRDVNEPLVRGQVGPTARGQRKIVAES
ncbi:hypothetical protein CONPUDRAFT_142041 [Coniophora puteana RWD-64-598 SS2]|uniref:Uncharacterized protein n=1 Tax=Coniophora puteana (strain RWD-64-598) TaxID=741705 RepID=A0A5M3N3A3_CONPW|nr:uncharacterized protein CONPUDRAFT_142041 [Coniophora puteana RWD-64-598 SS2]EIW85504.1 hypothetical protein CONPUDRAFT_142041 [Coniophora puteana RWD-64-598 SS2]